MSEKYVKSTLERKRYQIDWTDWLDAGELITTVDFLIVQNTVASPLVVDNFAVLPTGKGVQYYVSGGLTGSTYKIKPKITTNTTPTQIDEDAVFVTIREPT